MDELIPADPTRCQVYLYTPFALGGDLHPRCTNPPTYIVYETVPNADGRQGSQSVCTECRKRWARQTGNPNIDDTWRWQTIGEEPAASGNFY